MRRLLSLVLLPVTLAAQAPPGGADPELAPREYLSPQASGRMIIDGSLSEEAWRASPWSEPFVDIEGDRKPAPRFRTRMKILWDAECLYVGAELEEPDVWGTLRMRDTVIFQDNDFEVFIDPDGDQRDYYELEMNALNTCWDLFLEKTYKAGGHGDNSYDMAGLRTGVLVNGTLNDPSDRDRGWSVEIAIPWRAFGDRAGVPLPPRAGDRWRVNFSRVEWDAEVVDGWYRKIAGRPEHNWVWSPQGIVDMHVPETWGFLKFAGRSGQRPRSR